MCFKYVCVLCFLCRPQQSSGDAVQVVPRTAHVLLTGGTRRLESVGGDSSCHTCPRETQTSLCNIHIVHVVRSLARSASSTLHAREKSHFPRE